MALQARKMLMVAYPELRSEGNRSLLVIVINKSLCGTDGGGDSNGCPSQDDVLQIVGKAPFPPPPLAKAAYSPNFC